MPDKKTANNIAIFALAIAALVFPLSVAVSNAALALVLLLTLISGAFWQGCQTLWARQRLLFLAFLAIPALMLVSLLWSLDPVKGLGKIGHLWFWLLLPALISLLQGRQSRSLFFASLSAGLTLHLGYCAVQASGWGHIVVPSAASSPDDPAGLIGHIGFGFVYTLWAGWLFLEGMRYNGWRRWLANSLALWSLIWIFITQGRGGYMVAVAILILILWKEITHKNFHINHGWYGVAIVSMIVLASFGPVHDRIVQTWEQIRLASQGELHHTEARFPLWLASVKAWQQSPWIGYGTGSFKAVSLYMAEVHPELKTNQTPVLAHPHNIYLLAMVRMGILGLFALLGLLGLWVAAGIRTDWISHSHGYLIAAPGIALAVNGLTSSSIEEHFSGILAIFLLGLGLAIKHAEQAKELD